MTTNQPASEAEMQLRYDGPALANNRMDVRDIAPAIIAMAEVLRTTSAVLYPDRPEPRIEIQAAEPGSFIVQMIMSDPASLWSRAMGLFTNDYATAAANFTAISGTVIAITGFLAKHGYKRIRQVQNVETNAGPAVRITFSDGTSVELTEQAFRLLTYAPVRQPLRDVVRPLERQGVDTLRLSSAQRQAQVERGEVGRFDLPETRDEQLVDEVRPVALKLASVAFLPGNKWRLTDGDATFHATIADVDFLGKVERGEEEFSRTDILRVNLRTVQWRTESGLRSEHIVEKVVEHIRGPREVPLPFESFEDTDEMPPF